MATKVFTCFTPTDNRHHTVATDESFCVAFFKKRPGTWGRAPSRARRRETNPTPFFWFFFCGYLLKKRTEKNFSMLHVLTFYPLFSLTPQAQEKSLAKKKRREYFGSAEPTKGAALGFRDLFEKRSIKNFREKGCTDGETFSSRPTGFDDFFASDML